MKKITLICMLLLCNIGFMHAQDTEERNSKTKEFTIEAGLNQAFIADRVFSTHNFVGRTPGGSLGYLIQGDKSFLEIKLGAFVGGVSYNNTWFETGSYTLGFDVLYARKLIDKEAFKNYLGLKAKNQVQLLNYDGFDNGSWLTTLGVDLAYRGEYQLNDKHQLSLDFSYPIVAYAVRPPWAGFDAYVSTLANERKLAKIFFAKGIVTSGAKLIRPDLELGYVYSLSNKIDLGLNYQFTYLDYHPSKDDRNPKSINRIDNKLTLGLTIKL